MKQCPKCNRSYDDSQSFCLMDGTPLINEREEETLIRRKPAASGKSKILLWFGLALLAVLVGAVVTAAVMIYKFSGQSKATEQKRPDIVNNSPSPKPSIPKAVTPATTEPSSPTESPSPQTERTETNTNNDVSDEITPIAWNTTVGGFKSDIGQVYKFQCPEKGTESIIWGSDIYTLDSSICTAAVHAGLFTLESGGVVTVEIRPGRLTYGSTVRNGITSRTFGEYPKSFVVR